MDNQNLANLFVQFLTANAGSLLSAVAPQAGQASQPAITTASAPPTLPPASTHPSVVPQPPSAPPIQPYQSLRAAPSSLPVHLPPLPQLSSSSASLSSTVNQARLSHSASSQPRQPTLPRRRPRSNAVAAPSLPRAPDINSCMTTSGGQTLLRTMNVVFPPQIGESESDLFLMRFLKDTFLATMRDSGLLVTQTCPITTLFTDHISNIVNELRDRRIEINGPSSNSLLAHEDQPIVPLYIVNRGVPHPLRRNPVRPGSTIGDIAANRLQFAIPGLCIEKFEDQYYLCLSFVIRQPELTAYFSLPGPGQVVRAHHCLSQRLYTIFPRDRIHEQWPLADGDSSCGESDDALGLGDDNDDDYENLPPTPTPALPTRVL
ncbi:hypothetical protein C8R47DRAFT_1327041 [Mycena vitilis]|nr:hypothetical protein C8R47DRAFT_1327041 [Mycena vitilis]